MKPTKNPFDKNTPTYKRVYEITFIQDDTFTKGGTEKKIVRAAYSKALAEMWFRDNLKCNGCELVIITQKKRKAKQLSLYEN